METVDGIKNCFEQFRDEEEITFSREVHVDELRNGLQINISSRIG